MSAKQPFSPHYGTSQTLTAGAAALTANIDPFDKNVRIVNTGANIAYIRISSSSGTVVAATTADHAIPASSTSTVTKADGQDRLSYISAAGATLIVSTGEGW